MRVFKNLRPIGKIDLRHALSRQIYLQGNLYPHCSTQSPLSQLLLLVLSLHVVGQLVHALLIIISQWVTSKSHLRKILCFRFWKEHATCDIWSVLAVLSRVFLQLLLQKRFEQKRCVFVFYAFHLKPFIESFSEYFNSILSSLYHSSLKDSVFFVFFQIPKRICLGWWRGCTCNLLNTEPFDLFLVLKTQLYIRINHTEFIYLNISKELQKIAWRL